MLAIEIRGLVELMEKVEPTQAWPAPKEVEA